MKVVMSNSKARNAVVNDKAPPVVEDAGPAGEGILHPVDLVIRKKKRKCREQTTSRISQLVVSKETTGNLATVELECWGFFYRPHAFKKLETICWTWQQVIAGCGGDIC